MFLFAKVENDISGFIAVAVEPHGYVIMFIAKVIVMCDHKRMGETNVSMKAKKKLAKVEELIIAKALKDLEFFNDLILEGVD